MAPLLNAGRSGSWSNTPQEAIEPANRRYYSQDVLDTLEPLGKTKAVLQPGRRYAAQVRINFAEPGGVAAFSFS